ncbi:MAG: glycoside hydrolase family 16 protein [Planctomycetaceae bacterium]|jgi:beta-glucanase (GH16 family)|nr:glycoside hydrolase family 16 protein [Planctomycetaceae bacterium]
MQRHYFTLPIIVVTLLFSNIFTALVLLAEEDKQDKKITDNKPNITIAQLEQKTEPKPDQKSEPKKEQSTELKLVWEENFDGNAIDLKRWSKIPRGNADWARHMSDFDGCYEVKNGQLILRGLRNEHLPDDKSPYLTGGVYTKGKVGFSNGRIEIRAKLGNAKGAWPAFWLLPFDNSPWPRGGEIDIMERLNGDDFAHHTVHSIYTQKLKIKEPPQGKTAKINRDDYNVYAVELREDRLDFFINGKLSFTYPRIKTDKEEQFPFNREFYLLLDMQLGGSWVGEINPDDLPVEMQIDWVRFYKKK